MKRFFLDAILYPFLAIAFCLAFGLPFVFAGFQTVTARGTRDESGAVDFRLTREHFFGLYRVEVRAPEVTEARFESGSHRSIGRAPHRTVTVSGVYLVARDDHVPLFFGKSNLDDKLKSEAMQGINAFIQDGAPAEFEAVWRMRNLFGYVGLPFLALGLLGLAGWPFSILKKLREQE